MNLDKIQIGGVILAGGKSRRMDYSDKSLKKINKKTLLELVYRKAKKQVDAVAINSNAIANLKNLKNIEPESEDEKYDKYQNSESKIYGLSIN